jgi:energy-coupling factor transporter transmembrane protein EcfT
MINVISKFNIHYNTRYIMKTKTSFIQNLNSRLILIMLGKLTFAFFLLKGIFWLSLTGWLIYYGSVQG